MRPRARRNPDSDDGAPPFDVEDRLYQQWKDRQDHEDPAVPVFHLFEGDCRVILPQFPENSVQVCLTSPPYFGLRDYEHDGQIGFEESPAAYVKEIVRVMSEVARVLRPDGVAWLSIGDTYTFSGRGGGGWMERHYQEDEVRERLGRGGQRQEGHGFPPKCLYGIPWRVALALIDDGWTLRADVIYSKANSMPTPRIEDRPHTSHEYLFMLTRGRTYFFAGPERNEDWPKTVWHMATAVEREVDHPAMMPEELARRCIRLTSRPSGVKCDCDELIKTPTGKTGGRNVDPSLQRGRRGFHRPRGDEDGTAPMTRRQQRAYADQLRSSTFKPQMRDQAGDAAFDHYVRLDRAGARPVPPELLKKWIAAGWLLEVQPGERCDCPIDGGDWILDPFAGGCTTGAVAMKLGRRFVGIEARPKYVDSGRLRMENVAPLFVGGGD